jgi:hypothetical protein
MKYVPAIVGVFSALIYFYGSILWLAWEQRANVFLITYFLFFGGWKWLFPLFLVSCVGGWATFELCCWILAQTKQRKSNRRK